MTAPTGRRPIVTDARANLFLRLVAIAAVFAIAIAGFLCLSGVTPDRVGTGLIATAVLGVILILV